MAIGGVVVSPPLSFEQVPLPLLVFDPHIRPCALPVSPVTLYVARFYQHANALLLRYDDSEAWRLIATDIVDRLLDLYL